MSRAVVVLLLLIANAIVSIEQDQPARAGASGSVTTR